MALSSSISIPRNTFAKFPARFPFHSSKTSSPLSFSNFNFDPSILRSISCSAAKQGSGSVKSNKKKKKKKGGTHSKELGFGFSDVEIVRGENGGLQEVCVGDEEDDRNGYVPLPLPKPPAGFVVDEQGGVLMASSKRIVTIVDPTNNLPLECTIRRIFRSSKGDECMLLCPVDMPVEIVKSTSRGWSAVSDEEIEAILPTADYALAKIHMHLVHSGFCFTARGGFCYSEDSIFEIQPDEGEQVDVAPTEGVEITCFHLDGSHYMMYTPSDPLLFVAAKDQSGQLQIVEDVSTVYNQLCDKHFVLCGYALSKVLSASQLKPKGPNVVEPTMKRRA